jgi:hypothetical protein
VEPTAAELDRAGRAFLTEALGDEHRLRLRTLSFVHDIRIRDDIETARVRVHRGRFLLEVSPRFVATMLPTAEDKRFVLMHEVRHLERGDLIRTGRFYRRFPRLVNFAMDLYVNGSVLGSGYFDARSPGVLDRCYDPRRRPYCLLQPPWRLLQAWSAEIPDAADQVGTARYLVQHRTRTWGQDRSSPPRPVLDRLAASVATALSGAGFTHAAEAARLYLGGWSRTLPFNDFLQRFHALLVKERLIERVEQQPLLFEHELEALHEALRRAGRVAPGAGAGQEVSTQTVTPEQELLRSDAMRRFLHAVRAALVDDPTHPTLRRDAEVMFPSALLHIGRREAALLATDTLPVLFNAPGQALALSDERVHLYLDVSGSMDDTLAFVSGLTLSAGSLVGPTLHQFSNRVVTITRKQLEEGHIATTGGTDLDCVARHARKQGYRRILIVTDGHVRLADDSRRYLEREVETYVVLVDWHGEAPPRLIEDVDTYARRCWVLPSL